MRRLFYLLGVFLFLSSCTNYGDIKFTSFRRKNIKVYSSTDTSSKFVRNNIWSISKFLNDKLPKQKSLYEVYVLDREIKDLLDDHDFQMHILERMEQNSTYSNEQRTLAANLALGDMFRFMENEGEGGSQSLFFIPLANIILIRNDQYYDKDFFLYAYISLALIENNPAYYLNPAESRDEKADLLLFRYLMSGFNSLYARYFSKYHLSEESKMLYLKMVDIDIAYLEDIFELDPAGFKSKTVSALVHDESSIRYYPYFFRFLFEFLGEKEIESLINSFLQPDIDQRDTLRGYFYMWMDT